MDIEILSGENVALKISEHKIFRWDDPIRWSVEKNASELEFAKAYEIEHTDWDSGIQDCVWKLHDRTFTDMNCLKGKIIKNFPTERDDYLYQLRQYADGVKFLYYCEEVPTFDSDDRVWDSMKYRALYCDSQGINLIHCHEGYRLPRINICIGLQKASAEFFRWLMYIGCSLKNLPAKF